MSITVTPLHCPGLQANKNLSSFICKCPNCGKDVTAGWNTDDSLVCPDCKDKISEEQKTILGKRLDLLKSIRDDLSPFVYKIKLIDKEIAGLEDKAYTQPTCDICGLKIEKNQPSVSLSVWEHCDFWLMKHKIVPNQHMYAHKKCWHDIGGRIIRAK